MPLFLNFYGSFPSSFASNTGLFLGSTYAPTSYTTFLSTYWLVHLISPLSPLTSSLYTAANHPGSFFPSNIKDHSN